MSSGEWGGGNRGKKGKGQAKEHKQMTHGHRQLGVLSVGVGGGVRESSGEKEGQLYLNNN